MDGEIRGTNWDFFELPSLNPHEVESLLCQSTQPPRHWDTEELPNGLLGQENLPITNLEEVGIFQEEFKEEFKKEQASGLTVKKEEFKGEDEDHWETRDEVLTAKIGPNCDNKKNEKRNPEEKKKKIMLDDFLWGLLEKPEYNSYIQWTIKERLEFKLTRPEMVAQLWGEHRKKKRMNFDKLSRGLRYYYDSKRMSKVPYKQHHFRFVNRSTPKTEKQLATICQRDSF